MQRLLNTLQRKAEKTAERNRLSTQCTKISRQSAVKAKTLKNFQTLYQQNFVLGTVTKFFDSLFSQHDNGNEDRIWKWTDGDISQADRNRGVSFGGFGQGSPAATAYDVKWTFQCPQGQAMVAFASGAFRRNNERDRRWRYQCGRVNGLRARNPSVYAAWTDWANDWDKDMEINIPQSDFMVGFESVHDNSKEDRRFRYRTASLCRDRSRDIARLNDEIVALDAIIKAN